jgi:hypothetical protein
MCGFQENLLENTDKGVIYETAEITLYEEK